MSTSDLIWMEKALELAHHAAAHNEVPIGAVLVHGDKIIGEGWNQPISSHDPTHHAEIVALRAAAQWSQNYRLPETTLYVTVEPCAMCAGAIIQARIKRVVFGCHDPRAGAVESVFQILNNPILNHRATWASGILAPASRALLKKFFKERR